DGIRLTPEEIVGAAREQGAHVVGLSILSGSHVPLVKDVVARMKTAGLEDVPVVVGGIIPPEDAQALRQAGVAAVYTPKDFELNRIMTDVVRIVEAGAGNAAARSCTLGRASGLPRIDFRERNLEAGRIEADAAFRHDAREDGVGGSARMVNDARLLGIDNEIVGDARQPKIVRELGR